MDLVVRVFCRLIRSQQWRLNDDEEIDNWAGLLLFHNLINFHLSSFNVQSEDDMQELKQIWYQLDVSFIL